MTSTLGDKPRKSEICHRHRRPRIMGSQSKLRPNRLLSQAPSSAPMEKQEITRAASVQSPFRGSHCLEFRDQALQSLKIHGRLRILNITHGTWHQTVMLSRHRGAGIIAQSWQHRRGCRILQGAGRSCCLIGLIHAVVLDSACMIESRCRLRALTAI